MKRWQREQIDPELKKKRLEEKRKKEKGKESMVLSLEAMCSFKEIKLSNLKRPASISIKMIEKI